MWLWEPQEPERCLTARGRTRTSWFWWPSAMSASAEPWTSQQHAALNQKHWQHFRYTRLASDTCRGWDFQLSCPNRSPPSAVISASNGLSGFCFYFFHFNCAAQEGEIMEAKINGTLRDELGAGSPPSQSFLSENVLWGQKQGKVCCEKKA